MLILPTKSGGFDLVLLILRSKNSSNIQGKLYKKFKAEPNSEYERITKKIIYLLFTAGRNLNEVYENFFKEEFTSFYDYLEQVEGFSETFIEEIKNNTKLDDSLWEVKISDCEGYNFSQLFDDFIWENNNLIEILNNALKECENEN